jgi:hypothetical protein
MNNHGTYIKQGRKHTYTFPSISAYAAYVKEIDNSGKYWPYSKKSSRNNYGKQWASCSFDKALDRALNGGQWSEGAEQLQSVNLAGQAGEMIAQLNDELILAPAGGAVDIGEYLADGEECFYLIDQVEQAQTIVKIAVMNVCSADTTKEQVMNRGRAVMALVDALERRNLSVQLDVVDSFKKGSAAYPEYRTTIKQAGEPWAAGTVAYPLANASWGRRLGFRACEGSPCGSMSTSSYGGGNDLASWQGDTIASGEYDFVYGYMMGENVYNRPNSALRAVIKTANTQNPELLAG